MKNLIYNTVIMLGLIISVSFNLQQTHDNIVLEQKVAKLSDNVMLAKAAIKQQKERTPTVVSCANNQADYINALVNMEKKYDMPKGILQNIAYHESRYNPNAVSHAGAIGIMQIHPRWHKTVNPYNPYESIKYGAKYLDTLHKRFKDWDLALAAWNWGQGNLSKHTMSKAPRETRNFIKNVMKGIVV